MIIYQKVIFAFDNFLEIVRRCKKKQQVAFLRQEKVYLIDQRGTFMF